MLCRYPIHLNPKSLQVLKFLQMAVDLVVDLKLDQHTDMLFKAIPHESSTQNGLEERLAYLGCYYLSTRQAYMSILHHTTNSAYSIILPFGRPQPIPYSPYMQFCVDALPHDDTEARAQVLVKAHRLVEQATELNKTGAQPGSPPKDSQIESLIRQLNTIQQNLSQTNTSHRKPCPPRLL